jgi:hypothetical protein
MQVVVTDDGRGRDQSYVARIELDGSTYDGLRSFRAEGWGSTEIEARSHLIEQLMLLLTEVGSVQDQ